MSVALEEELAELLSLITANCSLRGVSIVLTGENSSRLLLLWLQYLRTSHATGTADCLIDGTASAIREGVACVALGLVRPALNALRLQIDLLLAWLYFKDHPVEWRRVQETGEGYRLKNELLKYLGETTIRFADRFGVLRAIKERTIEDPYRLLSAHIHGQSELVLPKVQMPKDILGTPAAQEEVLKLQFECSEYLNDILWSVFANSWTSIPVELRNSLEQRFKTPTQRAAFFS